MRPVLKLQLRFTGSALDWKPDVAVIIGGMVWERVDAPDIRDFRHASRSRGATIAGICGGTLALATAALLDTVLPTSKSADFLQQNAAAYDGRTLYRGCAVAVVADRVITAPGPAPVSFTCTVIERAGLSQFYESKR